MLDILDGSFSCVTYLGLDWIIGLDWISRKHLFGTSTYTPINHGIVIKEGENTYVT